MTQRLDLTPEERAHVFAALQAREALSDRSLAKRLGWTYEQFRWWLLRQKRKIKGRVSS